MDTTSEKQSVNGRPRPRRPRRAGPCRAVVLGLVVLLLVAACAGDEGSSSASSSESGGDGGSSGSDGVEFAQCMRDNGVADFPDPSPGGGFVLGGDLQSNPNFESALEACRSLMPEGAGGAATAGGVSDEMLLEFAQCMRDNGVDFPDPREDGALDVGGLDPNSPQFQSAYEACQGVLGGQAGGG